jgi:hypothetical protein
MQNRGVAWLPVEEGVLAEVAQIFRNMPDMDELFEDSKDGEVFGCEIEGPRGPARFICNRSAISENMRWLWAHDEETLSLFDDIASKANLLSYLGDAAGSVDDLMLYAASFIVVKGGELQDQETLRHADMGHRRVPQGSSFTLLASLTELPGSVGGLEFWPSESPLYAEPVSMSAPAHVHKYRPGKFIAFDGRLKHRTEPFKYERTSSESPVCDAYEASGHIRVLVSLAFGSSDASLARYHHKMLRKQTCHEEALIRQSPKREVDIDSELDTSASDSETKKRPLDALGRRRPAPAVMEDIDEPPAAGTGGYGATGPPTV